MTATPETFDRPARARYARELRAVNPRRLLDWVGFSIENRRVNPYYGYSVAFHDRSPREAQVAELLIGDVVADALLHPSLEVQPR
ncbi:MAG: hypothetical protein AB7U62_09350 [Pseudolabrys sp.]